MKKILQKLNKFIDIGITSLMIICCVFVILWVVSPIRDFLITHNIFSNDSYIGFVTSISILSVGLLWSIKYKIDSIENVVKNAVVNTINGQNSIIPSGIHDIYFLFDKVLTESENKKENKLYIIGSTLYTAWPHIHPWLLKETTMHWTVNLFLLDPLYIRDNKCFLDKDWKNTSESIIAQIKNVKNLNENEFVRRNITLKLFTYSYFPAIRGFSINGNVLITYSHWNKDGLADFPHHFYEYFQAMDTSIRAECYKSLYYNTLHFYEEHSKNII